MVGFLPPNFKDAKFEVCLASFRRDDHDSGDAVTSSELARCVKLLAVITFENLTLMCADFRTRDDFRSSELVTFFCRQWDHVQDSSR